MYRAKPMQAAAEPTRVVLHSLISSAEGLDPAATLLLAAVASTRGGCKRATARLLPRSIGRHERREEWRGNERQREGGHGQGMVEMVGREGKKMVGSTDGQWLRRLLRGIPAEFPNQEKFSREAGGTLDQSPSCAAAAEEGKLSASSRRRNPSLEGGD
uniref:Uncharacterized protein n=1 Tax=Oryza glumipatula TaxID=40148 RepID=A0A0D9Y7W7_9ORYZ